MAGVHILSHIETGKNPHWVAAAYSSVISGVVFLFLISVMVSMSGESPWAPIRMIGAILMGSSVVPPPATFSLGVFVSALIVHFVLSLTYGLVLSIVIFRLEEWAGTLAGAVFGLLIYVINFYGFTALFPWFAEARGTTSILAHLFFGLVAAWSYKELVKHHVKKEKHTA